MIKKIIICSCGIIALTALLFILSKSDMAFFDEVKVGNETVIENSRYEVFVDNLPENLDEIRINGKEYKAFCQYSRDYDAYNEYLAWHGCAVTSLTTILRAYVPECKNWEPDDTIRVAEKAVSPKHVFDENYGRKDELQMPITMYGISRILDKYNVDYEYVKSFDSDLEAEADIINHLKSGAPVVFIVSMENRNTGELSEKWTRNYHTMIMLGTDKQNNVVIADPANGRQRLKSAPVREMISYMWSCTEEPDGFYWNGKTKCGGYIKVK